MSTPPAYFPIKQEGPGPAQSLNGAWAGTAAQHINEIVTIADRRVRVHGAGLENASNYTYCRQWAYNNPNPTYTGPLDEGIKLPPVQHPEPRPQLTPLDSATPDVGDDNLSEMTEIEEKQRQRWKAAGEHMRTNAAERRAPYLNRLQAAMRPAR